METQTAIATKARNHKAKVESKELDIEQSEKRDLIAARLAEIIERDGDLTPDAVIKDAKDKNSPLHGEFEWDVNIAAYQHWVDRARRIIRSVKYVVIEENVSYSVPVYMRDPDSEGSKQGYQSVRTIQSSEGQARRALISEIKRCVFHLQRALGFAVVLGKGSEAKIFTRFLQAMEKMCKDD